MKDYDIYVLSLPDLPARRAGIKEQLARAGIEDYVLVDGVRAARLSQQELARRFDLSRKATWWYEPPTVGEIGCALGHHDIWQRIVRARRPALVLEDDVILEEGFVAWAEDVLKDLSNERVTVIQATTFPYVGRKSKMIRGRYRKLWYSSGTFLYFINVEAARILASIKPWSYADNWRWYRRQGIEILTLSEYPLTLSDTDSAVGYRSVWNTDWSVAKKLIHVIKHYARIVLNTL